MKILPHFISLNSLALLALTSLLAACAGGGGAGRQPGAPAPDPAAPPAPAAAPDEITEARGQVRLRNAPVPDEGLRNVEVVVMSGGRVTARSRTDSAFGYYRVNLVRGQLNNITARKPGYDFESLNITPQGPLAASPNIIIPDRQITDVLPVLYGDAINIAEAPGRNPEVALVRIPVTAILRVDPTSGALDAVLHGQRINIRNAANNRIIERITVDGQNRAVFQAVAGQEIIVEPAARRGTRWHPTSQRLRVDGRTPELVFEWRRDAREQGPPVLVVPPAQPQPAQPRAPRFPVPSPQTTPVPRIPLPQAARPPLVIPPAQANPMPRLQPTPVPRLPNRPLPTLPAGS